MSEAYISDEFVDTYKSKKIPWGFGALSYITYKRTYARVKEDNKLEEWPETIQRVLNGIQAIGAKYTQEEMEQLFEYMFHLKGTFGGRFLWQAGTKLGLEYGDSLCNCWALPIRQPKDFLFLFHELLCGGGVGYSIEREYIYQLPKIKKNVLIKHEVTKDADFIVSDSREGWVRLLEEVLNAYFKTGKSFTYSTILVRGKGEPIKGFGGVASGPLELVKGIDQICAILTKREGKKLRDIDVLDICNIIGSIVVSGNVRRSAQIAIGDADSKLFKNAKRWDLGNIPNWRGMSNNTIVADNYDYLDSEFWEGYQGNGEPYGLFNKKLAQKFGRLGEYIEDNCCVPNPCVEQILEPYESCNLSEIFLNNIESQEELNQVATLLYKGQKAVTQMRYLFDESAEVINRNARIGIGVTGIVQSLDKINWLDTTYKHVRAFDEVWSAANNWPKSIKITTLKPSGTLSLLSGSSPGIHPVYSEYYIRRMRIASNHQLVAYAQVIGLNTEYAVNFDNTYDYNTMIIEFPMHVPGAIYAKDMSAIQQLELTKKLQTIWSDSSVSVTVYYRKNELDDIKQWLKENYENSLKSVSFLLHNDHGFNQAPYEEIDAEHYDKLYKPDIIPIDEMNTDLLDSDCATGACPIR